jgi:two-component sensor histidine kinase
VLTREGWEGASLREIVAQAISPFAGRVASGESEPAGGRFVLEGPDLRLTPRTALALAMALQELATNAVKYGALSNETGQVRIIWSVDESRCLRLTWSEQGGPPVTPPSRRGFGSRLIERSLSSDLGGEVSLRFEPSGVVCTIEAPVSDSNGAEAAA